MERQSANYTLKSAFCSASVWACRAVIILAIAFGLAAESFGQGVITLNNRVPGVVVAPVYSCDPDCVSRSGNTSSGYPPGTQTYGGVLLADSGYTAELWYGPGIQPEELLVPAAPRTVFRTGVAAGYLVVTNLVLPGVPGGSLATVQLRVWENHGGAVTSWLQASADPTVAKGKSMLFTLTPGDGFQPTPPLIGLQSFSICAACSPMFLSQPQSRQTLPGEAVSFSVQASGTPPLTYQWRHDGTNVVDNARVTGATTSTLVISNVQPADLGSYSVVIANAFGAATSSAATLSLAPVVISSITLAGGMCTISFPTAPGLLYLVQSSIERVNWGDLAGPIFATGTNYSISVPAAFAQQYYRLRAGSSAPVYSMNVVGYLNAGVGPGYNVVFNPFRNLLLQDAFPNPPPGTFVYLPNGSSYDMYYFDEFDLMWIPTGAVPLPAGTNFTLYVSEPFTFTLAGEVFEGPPNAAPEITTQPQSRQTLAGETVSFSVQASGSEPLTYQWRHNGLNVADDGRISGANTSMLTISGVQSGDLGDYSVIVNNAFGSATSGPATLTFGTVTISSISLVGSNCTIGFPTMAGVPYRVQAGASPYGPFVTYAPATGNGTTMYFTKTRAPQEEYFRLLAGSGMSVYSVNMMGYARRVMMPGTNVVSNPFRNQQLQNTIPNPPAYTQVAIFNGTAYEVYYFDDLAMQWFPTGAVDLPTGTNFIVAAPSAFSFMLLGEVAQPTMGEAPVIVAQPQSQTVPIGTNVLFAVEATGTQPLSYQWRFNGQNIIGATSSAYVLVSVQPTNAGVYSVIVSNVAGSAVSANATLTVLQPSTIEFGQPALMVAECTLGLWIPIRRTGSTDQAATVEYATYDVTAFASFDYYSTTGAFTLPPGQVSDSLFLYVMDDGVFEEDETFLVALSNPSPGVVLGAQSNTVVKILDNDRPSGAGEGVNWPVWTLAVQPDGKTVIGGDFTQGNAANRMRVARLNVDGSIDPSFDPGVGPDQAVVAMAIQPDGKIVIGGWFDAVSGVTRNYIARLNADGTLDSSFDPGGGANNLVEDLAVQPDGKILLVGGFSQVGDVLRNGIARLNADGSLDPTFNPGAGANAAVRQVDLQADGRIVLCGWFSSFNAIGAPGLVRLNSDGSVDPTFNVGTGANGWVLAILAMPDGKLLVGGDFASFNGVPAHSVARLNPDGAVDPSFSTGAVTDAVVTALALQPDGRIVAGGDWSVWNGVNRSRLVRLNSDGSLDSSFAIGGGVVGQVFAVAARPDGGVAVGGDFSIVNGFNRYRFALLNADGSQQPEPVHWVQWAPPDGNGHWYALTPMAADWNAAESRAASYGGHLVSIGSSAEQSFMQTTFLRGLNYIRPLWIGLNDANAEGTFVWSSGEPFPYANWISGEPNDYPPGEDYVAVNWHFSDSGLPSSQGLWNDLPAIGTTYPNQAMGPHFGIMELTNVSAPEILTQPQSQVVSPGSNVTFSVVATGQPPPEYQWRFNGAVISGATQSSLTIANAQPGNGGIYDVIVRNFLGEVISAPASLAVYTAPQILVPPTSLQVVAGSPAQFTVIASSSSPLQYQWLFEGTIIPGTTNASLVIAQAQPADAGIYSVQVIGFAGSVTSPGALLTVLPPPEEPIPTQSYSVAVRTGLNLIANQLNRGGNTLREIMPVVPNGAMVSKYDNTSRSWFSSTYYAALGAWVPPNIVLKPGEGAFLNSPVDFTLNFTGTPNTPVLPIDLPEGPVWLLSRQTNGVGTYENIVGRAPWQGTVVYKWINSSGSYQQYLFDGETWSNSAPQVAVGEAVWIGLTGGFPPELPSLPVITLQPLSATVAQGEAATFFVEAAGSGPLTYQWRLNGNNILGATDNVLVIGSLVLGDAGDYSVVVANPVGSISSEIATLRVLDLSVWPFANAFAQAGTLPDSPTGVGTGNNALATRETDEPHPLGVPRGASVWLQWQPSSSGLVTFTTAGSSFDTLLAVYTGTALNNLVTVAADDDSAPFLCSRVSFQAFAGMTYYIQVDGYYGATGVILLSWNLEPTVYPPPVILTHPQSQTVLAGSNAVLSVIVEDPAGIVYQWYLDNVMLPGATNDTVLITGIGPSNVGNYLVTVTNRFTQLGTVSSPANVQLFQPGEGQRGNPTDVAARDKLSSATDLTPPDPNIHDPAPVGSFTGTQTFSTANATADPGEPNHCGYAPCKTYWCSYQAPASGLLTIDTIGTTFNAVLAVYTGPGTSYSTLVPVACSANHGPGNESVTFAATAGTQFWVVIMGVGCATGSATVNYTLSATPHFTSLPLSQTVATGGRLTLTAAVVGAPTLRYQWRCNGTNIPGATGTSLVVPGFAAANQGNYTILVTNLYGTNISAPASVFLNDPPRFLNAAIANSSFNMQFVGQGNTNYVLESCDYLGDWRSVRTNSSPLGIINFSDAVNSETKFYRVRKP